MKIVNVAALLSLTFVLTIPVFAVSQNAEIPSDSKPAGQTNLNQFIYSYGTVLKVSPDQVVLQEYDYDSDVEKEVAYQIDPAIQLEGFKAITDLAPQDVVEVYYLEQDNKKTAKIIRREAIEEETAAPANT